MVSKVRSDLLIILWNGNLMLRSEVLKKESTYDQTIAKTTKNVTEYKNCTGSLTEKLNSGYRDPRGSRYPENLSIYPEFIRINYLSS